jgi:hypothetical protein
MSVNHAGRDRPECRANLSKHVLLSKPHHLGMSGLRLG